MKLTHCILCSLWKFFHLSDKCRVDLSPIPVNFMTKLINPGYVMYLYKYNHLKIFLPQCRRFPFYSTNPFCSAGYYCEIFIHFSRFSFRKDERNQIFFQGHRGSYILENLINIQLPDCRKQFCHLVPGYHLKTRCMVRIRIGIRHFLPHRSWIGDPVLTGTVELPDARFFRQFSRISRMDAAAGQYLDSLPKPFLQFL